MWTLEADRPVFKSQLSPLIGVGSLTRDLPYCGQVELLRVSSSFAALLLSSPQIQIPLLQAPRATQVALQGANGLKSAVLGKAEA